MTATENIQRKSLSRTIATNFQSSLALLFSISSLVKAAMYLTLWMALLSSGHRSLADRLRGGRGGGLGGAGGGRDKGRHQVARPGVKVTVSHSVPERSNIEGGTQGLVLGVVMT